MNSQSSRFRSGVRTLLLVMLALGLLSGPLCATWSIVIVDMATGEVAIGIATCLTFTDLRDCCVVVVPGVGVAAAQSFVGPLSLRQLIRQELLQGTPPAQILTLLAAADPGHQLRQYGIASVQGGAATFTGTGAGAFAGGLTGQIGSLAYAIQGNVLTGNPVILNAEQALITTQGSMAQRLMAAMQAARQMGGDGRCSCSQSAPTSCGSPPPSFSKSSHVGLMFVSRPGDQDAPCSFSGCANGTYYMELNVANQPATAADPIIQLQQLFSTWQATLPGRPDHFLSTVSLSGTQMAANGADTVTATVVLRDVNGVQLATSPSLTVALDPASTATDVQIGPVTALGNGTYTFDAISGLTPGQAILNVVADDGQGAVRISPNPVLTVGDPFGPCGTGDVRDAQGNLVDILGVNGSPGADRIVVVGVNQPLTVALASPPLHPAGTGLVGHHLLWARAGVPLPGENTFLGAGVGTLCFQPPSSSVAPGVVLLASSLGGGLVPGSPAPWSTTLPGLPAPADITLQGVIVDDTPLEVAATNALLLRVVLLPAPVITEVSPLAPLPGDTVTVSGSGFQPGVTLDLAGQAVTPTTLTAETLTFLMPAGVPCDALLTLTNPDNQSATAVVNGTPTITSTVLGSGPASGGSLFVILGNGFPPNATATIGGAPAQVNAITPTTISITTPPGVPGVAPVVLTTPTGCTVSTTYTYL